MSRDYRHLKLKYSILSGWNHAVPCAIGMSECSKPHDAWNEEVELSMSRPIPRFASRFAARFFEIHDKALLNPLGETNG